MNMAGWTGWVVAVAAAVVFAVIVGKDLTAPETGPIDRSFKVFVDQMFVDETIRMTGTSDITFGQEDNVTEFDIGEPLDIQLGPMTIFQDPYELYLSWDPDIDTGWMMGEDVTLTVHGKELITVHDFQALCGLLLKQEEVSP